MAINEMLQEEWNVAPLEIAALAQFVRHVRRYILRPFLGDVEGDDPGRVFVLAVQQIGDDGFQVGGLDVSLPVYPAIATEVIDTQSTASSPL
jgi:hypothetical protein